MSLATETRELTSYKLDIIHKLFLIGLLESKGLELATRHRTESDIKYLNEIMGTDLGAERRKWEAELFQF